NGDEPAVIEFSHLGPFRPAPKRALQIGDVSIGRRTLGVGAARKTMFEEFAKRYSGRRLGSRQPIYPLVLLVAQNEAPVGVEHAQPLRHVLERGVKMQVACLELTLMLHETLV